MRPQSFDVADEEHSEEEPRRNAGPPTRFGIVGIAELFDERVESVRHEEPVQGRLERMARGLRQVRGDDECLRLPPPDSLSESHRSSWVRWSARHR